MSVLYHAVRDNPGARTDEDAAMCHVNIVSQEPDIEQAKDALRDYMIGEAEHLERDYGPNARYASSRNYRPLLERAVAIRKAASDIADAAFSGEKRWEAINFEADKIRFQLVRVEREDI